MVGTIKNANPQNAIVETGLINQLFWGTIAATGAIGC